MEKAIVKLLSYTPNPEKVVACAAKLCYSASSIDNINDNLTDEKVESFVDMLSDIGHESPIEHVSFTFGISGVSRSFLAQFTRHRIASFSVQSQRYVSEESIFDFVIPPHIEENPKAKEAFIQLMNEAKSKYDELSGILKEIHKKRLIQDGYSSPEAEKKALKLAIEDARFVLPNACVTKLICTMNARSLLNFFKHRCCNRAQWEIRDVAEKMLVLVLDVAPHLFKNAGPSCITGACPEGKMCCKKAEEVRKYFRELKMPK